MYRYHYSDRKLNEEVNRDDDVKTMSIVIWNFISVRNSRIKMGLQITSNRAKSTTKIAMMMPAIAPPCNAFDFASDALSLLLDGPLDGDTVPRDGRFVGCSVGSSVGAA